jgi:hypothetical protein
MGMLKIAEMSDLVSAQGKEVVLPSILFQLSHCKDSAM